jgi:acetoacetyl-CoA synthetase
VPLIVSDTVEAAERDVLWTPTPQRVAASRMAHFQRWLAQTRDVHTGDYLSLWRWSVTDLDEFWSSMWDYFDVIGTRGDMALADARMPGAQWFPGARVNWAQNLLRRPESAEPAIIGTDEQGVTSTLSWAQLSRQVANLGAALRGLGVQPGDRVAAVLPNIAPTVVAVLAAASIGAVWSCCSPDFGLQGLISRFAQIEPTVVLGVDGYRYNGRDVDRTELFDQLRGALPSVTHSVMVRYLDDARALPVGVLDFGELITGDAVPVYEQLPFDHPLWILYSSGTTGPPKGIVHSHGGILLESLKANGLHYDLGSADRVFIAASTAWVVWNMLIDSMTTGATIVTYDGSPLVHGPDTLFGICAQQRVTRFGTGAAYLTQCEKAGSAPAADMDLSALRSILSTGSPLPDSTYRWVYREVAPDVHLGSDSGGTDVATAFVGANPLEPVRAGELQGPCLGVAVQAWDDAGHPVIGEVGEMVVTAPMPSMPLSFWNDPDGSRYRDAYFSTYPKVWRHGDWITMTASGSCIVHGRSDSTINRGGVRMGSADIYVAVEALPEIASSLVVGAELADGGYYMPLFVTMEPGHRLDDGLRDRIRKAVRDNVSPRHVPDAIIEAPAVPMTRTGKRLEVPVKKLLQGVGADSAVNRGTVADLDTWDWYVTFAEDFRTSLHSTASQTR